MDSTAVNNFCRAQGVELLVLFGSLATHRDRPGSDIDIAVKMKKGREADKLELIYRFGEFFPSHEVDLVVLSIDTDPVLLFEIFSSGKMLYQERPDAFEQERLRAYKLYYDTEKLRRLQSDYLKTFAKGGRHVA